MARMLILAQVPCNFMTGLDLVLHDRGVRGRRKRLVQVLARGRRRVQEARRVRGQPGDEVPRDVDRCERGWELRRDAERVPVRRVRPARGRLHLHAAVVLHGRGVRNGRVGLVLLRARPGRGIIID